MRTTLTLLGLLGLVSLGACLAGQNTKQRYSCGDHGECAGGQLCNGVERGADVADGEPCDGEDGSTDGVLAIHEGNACYYPYCAPQNDILCGQGVCEDGLCVVVEEGIPDSVLKCMPWHYTEDDRKEPCGAIWEDCGDAEKTCVFVFEFMASGAEGPDQRICVIRDELVEPI